MNRDSESEHPSQRTVAELLAQHGNSPQGSSRRRRRRAEDPSETAPQAIIDRVLSDSGRMRPVRPEEEEAPGHPPEQSRPSASPSGGPPTPGPSAPPAGPSPDAVSNSPQPPATQAPPPQSAAPPSPETAAPPAPAERSGSGNFWARRFAAAGRNRKNPAAPAGQRPDETGAAFSAAPPTGDTDTTARQPIAPSAPPAPASPPEQPPVAGERQVPAPPPAAGRPADSATEQFPRFEGDSFDAAMHGENPIEDENVEGHQPVPDASETAVMVPATSYAEDRDPYDDEAYDDYHEYESYDYREDNDDDAYNPERPAGLEADDSLSEGEWEDEAEKSPGKEWFTLAAQGGASLLAGGLVWVSFRWLWNVIPWAALVAALAVTGVLVLVARRFLRNDDVQTILLAVLVGLTCTVSPAALLLVGQ